jgi:hypothetical protein
VPKNRSGDREARLARALRENLKRRKARDRATAVPAPDTGVRSAGRPNAIDVADGRGDPRRPNPAPKRD